MRILDFLQSDAILPSLKSETKEAVLAELVEPIAVSNPGIDSSGLVKILIARENLGSTGIGGGIAIPHGKYEGLQQLTASFGRSTKGIDFNSMDNKPAYLFFLIVAPMGCAGEHLKALARISRLFKDPLLKTSLQKAQTADDIFRIIEDHDMNISA